MKDTHYNATKTCLIAYESAHIIYTIPQSMDGKESRKQIIQESKSILLISGGLEMIPWCHPLPFRNSVVQTRVPVSGALTALWSCQALLFWRVWLYVSCFLTSCSCILPCFVIGLIPVTCPFPLFWIELSYRLSVKHLALWDNSDQNFLPSTCVDICVCLFKLRIQPDLLTGSTLCKPFWLLSQWTVWALVSVSALTYTE